MKRMKRRTSCRETKSSFIICKELNRCQLDSTASVTSWILQPLQNRSKGHHRLFKLSSGQLVLSLKLIPHLRPAKYERTGNAAEVLCSILGKRQKYAERGGTGK